MKISDFQKHIFLLESSGGVDRDPESRECSFFFTDGGFERMLVRGAEGALS